jgi:hypothetical protein
METPARRESRPAGALEGGFHEGLATSAYFRRALMMRRLHTRSAAASNIGEPIPLTATAAPPRR